MPVSSHWLPSQVSRSNQRQVSSTTEVQCVGGVVLDGFGSVWRIAIAAQRSKRPMLNFSDIVNKPKLMQKMKRRRCMGGSRVEGAGSRARARTGALDRQSSIIAQDWARNFM